MDDLAASAVWGLLIGATLVGGALGAVAAGRSMSLHPDHSGGATRK